jgi:PAS domain S-box-containing protein
LTASSPTSKAVARARILLVDDNLPNLIALEALLEPLGQELVRVTSGEEALKCCAEHEFAVVLMDVRMPGLDGFDTARRMRERENGRRTPIIFLTALGAEEEDHALAYSQGAVDFLVKPFRPAALLSKVRVFVDLYLKEKTIVAQQKALGEAEREALERQSESRLQTIIDLMPLCVVALHADGTPYFCNRAWREYTGIELDQASPSTLLGAIHPEDLPRLRDTLQGALRDGQSMEIECRLRSGRDGTFRWHIGRAMPELGPDGAIVGWIASATDVERQKRAERDAVTANRTKDEFLAIVSHDLRTPLTAILGWAGMLTSGNPDASKLKRGLETIQRSARAQALLIDDILDVARIMSGKMSIEPVAVDVKEVVAAALDAVQPSALEKNVAVETRLEEVPTTFGDPDRLQQVVWNLAMNAIKFTPKGGTVEVELRCIDGCIQVRVRDNGRGIDPAFLPHVFDRFRQARTDGRADGGLGLGLAIVRHIVELHQGDVTAESAGAGRGAAFTVRLPIIQVGSSPDSADRKTGAFDDRAQSSTIVKTLRGVKVLVVDDELDVRDFLATVLGSAGAEVICAASTREALEVVRHSPPDVLLSDVAMPGEDGYSLIRKIRALQPEQSRTVRAVALTAYTRPEDANDALDAGFDRHVAKPVEPFELVGIVAQLINRGSQAEPSRTSSG